VIGLKIGQSLVQDLSMPVGNRHSVLFGSDPVPKCLDVFNLLVDVEFVEAWLRK